MSLSPAFRRSILPVFTPLLGAQVDFAVGPGAAGWNAPALSPVNQNCELPLQSARGEHPPVKPSKNVTLALPVEPFDM